MNRNTNAIGIVNNRTTVPLSVSLTQIEIKIVQTEYICNFYFLILSELIFLITISYLSFNKLYL